ncbi:Proteophosphoglycan 5, related [Eimeria acervulina]|uniref:Proteophosphoglycan 5, related n=1 Tax=Eimeria acervulina TaxID=5801 RepID=U6GW90_EIMAC|nr:Proteophosphoglycan 5, related [Eimeria acervulina]CDI83872.1 Proteophosphoglycan 5, related [Eimeria acervulina]
MNESPRKAALSESSQNELSSGPSAADASGRMLSLLSQSELRQQLVCQVRYFLSGKLLNCACEEGGFYECTSLEQCGEDQKTAKKTLAFKATLSLVLLWLKAHGLVHTAGVLCPEADIRTSDILSQEECQTVLQLPKTLLRRPANLCVSSGLQWNLLDRLIDAASQYGAAQTPNRPRSTDEVLAAESRACRAGDTGCFPSDGGASSPCRTGRTEYVQRTKRIKGASCPPRSARKQKVESMVSVPFDSPTSRSSPVDGIRWNDWRETTQNKMLLLEAHLKGLELRESSKKLFAVSEDSRKILDLRIANLEGACEKRMRQLEEAIDQATGSQGTEALDSTVGAQVTMHEAKSKLEVSFAQQKEREARLTERETKLSERERLLDAREKDLLRAALNIHKDDFRTEQNETNMLLTQENASFRSQLAQAKKQVKMLEAQLQKQAAECMHEYVNYTQPTHTAATKNPEELVACANHPSLEEPSITQRDVSSEHAAQLALKQEYEGHVARLTDEIQRSNDRIRNKDAEFKLLVVELESARRKHAEAQRRLKKMQKLYEAARATCVQHRKLASSMSLSLSCIDFAVEPPAEFADRGVRDLLGGENVSPNAHDLQSIAGNAPEVIKNGQPPAEEYGVRGDYCPWNSWGDLNNGFPRKEIDDQSLLNASCDLQKQSYKSQSSQTIENLADSTAPDFQRCSIAASERQPVGSLGFRTANADLQIQSQKLNDTSNAVERTVCTPLVRSGHAGTDTSDPRECTSASQERHYRKFSPPVSGESGQSNSNVLRDVSKEVAGTSRSSAPLLFPETASEAPPLRETTSAGVDLHCVPLKQAASVSLSHGLSKASEESATMDNFSERHQGAEVDHRRRNPCSKKLEAKPGNTCQTGPEHEESQNMGYSAAGRSLPSPENSDEPLASNAPLNDKGMAAPRLPPEGVPNELPCKDPVAITITRTPSIERQLKGSGHECPSTVIENHSTHNASEAASARHVQEFTVTASPRSPRENTSGGRQPPASTPPGSCGREIHCFSPVAENISRERSPRANDGAIGSHLQSPWAEASIASSLPESPQVLSNFPSLSCPVAATIEAIPSPTRSKVDCREGWTALRRKPPSYTSGIPASSSPSEHEWLACISPTDPVIRTNATADNQNEA